MRPSSSRYANPFGLVDKRVGNMFSEIEQVRAALPQISHLSYYLESIFNLQRNLDLLSQQDVSHHILKDITVFQGANAYELALANGFVGTNSQWLESLRGPRGYTGLLDEVAHQILIDGIADSFASITATNLIVSNHTTAIAGRLTITAFDLYAAGIQDQLNQLEANIIATIPGLVPPLDEDAVTELAQLVYDNAISDIVVSITDVNNLLDAANLLIDGLRLDLDANYATFNDFVFSNGDTIGRVTSLESVTDGHGTAITTIAAASSDNATLLVSLQAESATHFASILNINTVQANQATQINTLQVSNNANYASIVAIETAYVDADTALAATITALTATVTTNAATAAAAVAAESSARSTADEAAALDRLDIRADFAAADTSVASTAAALVSTEATARSTADAAAATDRALIRTQFASADTAVLTSATALVTSEATARSTADSAAATDRAAIRAEFAFADAGVLSSATALVSAETTARTTAISAAASDRTLIRSEFATADAGVASTAAALVATEASTRATAVSAVASSVSTLSATVGSHSASLSTQASAIANVDGRVSAAYNLKINVDGRISGFTSEDDGDVSTFEVLANVFKIVDPSGGARTEYSNGNWRVYDSAGNLRVRLGVW